jgi:hypothetical protein
MAFRRATEDIEISFAIGTVVYNPEHDLGQCRVCNTRYEIRNGSIVNPVTASLVNYCVACVMEEERIKHRLIVKEDEQLPDWGAF